MSPWAWSSGTFPRLILGVHRDGTVSQWIDVNTERGTAVPADWPTSEEPIGITSTGELLFWSRPRAYDSPLRQLDLQVGQTQRVVSLAAPESHAFATADRGPWIEMYGKRITALAYRAASIVAVTYSEAGDLEEQVTLEETDAPLSRDENGLVVLAVPEAGGRQAALIRITAKGRTVIGHLPVEAQAVLPGGTRS